VPAPITARRPRAWLVPFVVVAVGAAVPAAARAAPGLAGAGQQAHVAVAPAAAGLAQGMMPPGSPDAVVEPAGPAARSAATPAAVVSDQALGIDIASYQHPGGAPIDWRAVAASGQSFVVVKATENGYTNPYLSGDVSGARAAGLATGAYAFARPSSSAIAQADGLAAAIRGLSLTLSPVLDLEDSGGLSPGELVAWTHAFLDRFATDTGLTAMIYSGPSFWSGAMGGDTGFTNYPLWEAHYTAAASPAPMGGWPSYLIWQYSSTGSIPGIASADVDHNRFNGTRSQLATTNAIDAKYLALGGSALLGAPTSAEVDAPSGRVRHYQRGDIYWAPDLGAHTVYGAILSRYLATGGAAAWGIPTADEGAAASGRVSTFRKGNVYWDPAGGAHAVYGAILGNYLALGGPAGPLGMPAAEEAAAPGGRMGAFRQGQVLWSPATGAHSVRSDVLPTYLAYGGPGGPLGFPLTDEAAVPGGWGVTFRGGDVYSRTATGRAAAVYGAIRARYLALGGSGGFLGLPTADESAVQGGRASTFEQGTIYYSSTTGVPAALHGGILGKYQAAGGPAGVLGLPTGDEQAVPGGRLTTFVGGNIYYSLSTGTPGLVRGAILGTYLSLGGPGGFLGLPTGDEQTMGAGQVGPFEHGDLLWSATTGTHEVHGAILGRYDTLGGAAGTLGLPVSNEYAVPGGRRSDFVRGALVWDAVTGLVTAPGR